MEEPILLSLKDICCTCLSIDRKLKKLCEIEDGINNLFFLLSCDSEAYELLCYREATDLYICWECTALLNRLSTFQQQACTAQKQLQNMVNNKEYKYNLHKGLSVLSQFHQNTNNYEYLLIRQDENQSDDEYANESIKNDSDAEFLSIPEIANSSNDIEEKVKESDIKIDQSIIVDESDANVDESDITIDESDIKDDEPDMEIDESDPKIDEYDPKTDESNSQLEITCEEGTQNNLLRENVKTKKIAIKKLILQETINYSTVKMTASEMRDSLKRRRAEQSFVDAMYKCDSCVEVYKDLKSKQTHINRAHKKLPNHEKCNICNTYVRDKWYEEHRSDHYLKFQCHYCDHVSYNVLIILKHLRIGHAVKYMPEELRRLRRLSYLKNPGLKPWSADVTPDKRTTVGYVCSVCSEFFESKKKRNTHIEKVHKNLNHKCSTCGKTFAGIQNLRKHEKLHSGTLLRQPCPVCGKVVRYDTMKTHLLTHGERPAIKCYECDKTFASQSSYYHHMKLTKTHAGNNALKIKCPLCDRGFRTKADCRDHVNYRHRGKSNHKCDICNKIMSTGRLLRRHMRETHYGQKKVKPRKIYLCQTCGKVCRDVTALREHESLHTGEKLLTCKLCGNNFRTSKALSRHKRVVHKVVNRLLLLKYTESDIDDVEQ
ncbi:zinc finger protein 761-like [Melitaea cinxia]|uniref:zinc finger protein 761-like n=1 Tax=Melitaea cinxia TaxID=113334 RepID=UPI001E274876|nr:zinc finger protein 761-like [Melitaea cinxia]